jgi:AraC-like DNA-binding protein
MKRDIHLSETTEAGRGTKERVVRASADDSRDWLLGAPVCDALARHDIVHVGVADAVHPYRVVRTDLSGAFVMACVAGEGRVWLDGMWKPMRAGMACLAPPHAFHAYRAVAGRRWGLVWVRYQGPIARLPIVSAQVPVLAPFDGRPLRSAVEGLHVEAVASATPAALQLWAHLADHYARTFAQAWRGDDRLSGLWDLVSGRIDEDWPLERLAREAALSARQLRRLCQNVLGRTPAQQVTSLRLQRAASLLSTTQDKVEVIARSVGYASLFTFSHNFKRFTGCRPSAFRSASKAQR